MLPAEALASFGSSVVADSLRDLGYSDRTASYGVRPVRCRPDEVLVLGGTEGASPGSVWGEICSTAAAQQALLDAVAAGKSLAEAVKRVGAL